MENLPVYLLKASAGIAVFYIVYWFFLQKETFFAANRFFLLGGLVLATLLPMVPVHYAASLSGNQLPVLNILNNNQPSGQAEVQSAITSETFSWGRAVLFVYFTGVAIFFMRLLVQTLAILRLIFKFRIRKEGTTRIVENDRYGLPFSFFNLVFINPKFHTRADLPEILAHEQVHIRELHWADLVITELLTVIFWFNPFVWMVEHAIKQNHEYLADSGVIARGHSLGRYQALLVNQLMGMQIVGVTNNLNFALNKKRFNMMTKTKTPKIKAVKFAWFMPALAALLVAFAEPDYSASIAINNSKSILNSNLDQKNMVVSGKVVDENGGVLPGASVVLKGTTLGTSTDMDGKFTLEIPDKDATIFVSFVGLKTVELPVKAGGSKANQQLIATMAREICKINATKITAKPKEKTLPPSSPAKAKSESATPPKTSDMEKREFFAVEEMPNYPGGMDVLHDFVQKLAQEYSLKENLKGKSWVNFTVGADGKVKNIKAEKADNEGISKASEAIVSKMKDWKPGKQHGKSVPVDYNILIEF
jgi:hypothetical protein